MDFFMLLHFKSTAMNWKALLIEVVKAVCTAIAAFLGAGAVV